MLWMQRKDERRMMLDIPSFGDTLKTLRKRKHVQQLKLADQLGVHRNTVGAWERGEYYPASRGRIVEIAVHLRLDSEEYRQLLKAALLHE